MKISEFIYRLTNILIDNGDIDIVILHHKTEDDMIPRLFVRSNEETAVITYRGDIQERKKIKLE